MALFTRSVVWSARLRGDMVLEMIRELAGSVRTLSGYSLLTGLGLLLGLVRELAVASAFGLSPQLDVFVAVLTIQLFFGAQVGNALETAFISRVASEEKTLLVYRSLWPAIYGLLLVHVGIIGCLLVTGSILLDTIFPSFDPGQLALASHTLHALFLPIIFASTAGLLRGALAVLGSFAPGFLAGSIVSCCTIVSVLLFSSSLGIDALTLGVSIGNLGVLSLFAGRLVFLKRDIASVAMPTLSKSEDDGSWFVLWGAAATVLIGELVYAGMALTERSLASRLPPGSIAAFFYASTIVSVPLSLIVRPVTTMLFPRMVKAFKEDVRAGLSALRVPSMALVTASAVVVLLVSLLTEPIVETVFVRGRFSLDHAKLTASILSVTIFALPFMSVGQLIRNACYSLSDYRSPIVGLVVQWTMVIGLGAVLLPRYGARGLATALVSGEAAVLGVTGLLLMRQVARS